MQISVFSRFVSTPAGVFSRTGTGRRRRRRALAVAFALAVLPACGQSRRIAAEADAVRSDAARIEAALAEIESRALRDPELARLNQALGEELMAAMVRVDPGLPAAAGRLAVLGEDRERAVRSGDPAAAAELDRRIAAIQQRYLRAQAEALEVPSLADRVAWFKALLRRRMIETDAAAAGLLHRYAELHDLLPP